MPDQLKAHLITILRDALSQAIPESPSGSHCMLVIGQLVVNIQQPTLPVPPEFEHPGKRRSTK